MSKLWTSNGKLVCDSSGKLILCDTCPCDGAALSCSGLPIPSTIYVTFGDSGGVDDLSYLGTIQLNYNSSTIRWESSAFTSPCNDLGLPLEDIDARLFMRCQSDVLEVVFVHVLGGSSSSGGTVTIINVDPFYATNPNAIFEIPGCLESKRASVTITETAP